MAQNPNGFEYREFSEISPEFIELTRALDRELRARNGEAQDTYDGFNALTGIADVVLAYHGGVAVGCASFKRRSATVAEVKRVYVAPQARGRGVSKALMALLEQRARSSGVSTLLVETSRTFPEANGLYPGLGYRVTENFPPYEGLPLSICFRKDLA